MKADFFTVINWIFSLLQNVWDFISEHWILSVLLFVPFVAGIVYWIFETLTDAEASPGVNVGVGAGVGSHFNGNASAQVRSGCGLNSLATCAARVSTSAGSSAGMNVNPSVNGVGNLAIHFNNKRKAKKAEDIEAQEAYEQVAYEQAILEEEHENEKDIQDYLNQLASSGRLSMTETYTTRERAGDFNVTTTYRAK